MQLVVKFLSTHVLNTKVHAIRDGFDLRNCVSCKSGVPSDFIAVAINGKRINDDFLLESITDSSDETQDSFVSVTCFYSGGLKGGKGGFGAALRAASKQKGVKRTTDFGSCRDLNGRRLKQVNDEILLQKWQDAKDEGKDFDVGEKTASGIDLWYLKTPNWADPFKESYRKKFMRTRAKRDLCSDWCRARGLKPSGERAPGAVAKHPPVGAPAHWGCPRGARCEWAHGEAELRDSEAKERVRETRRRGDFDAKQDQVQRYVASAQLGGTDMTDAVARGLRQQAHWGSTTVDSESDDTEEEEGPPGKRAKTEEHGAVHTIPVIPRTSEDISFLRTAFATYAREEKSEAPFVSCRTIDSPSGNVVSAGAVGAGADLVTSLFSCPVRSPGAYYYEVELITGGLAQIGWALERSPLVTQAKALGSGSGVCCLEDSLSGVGDDPFSFGYDGWRQRKWHSGASDSDSSNDEGTPYGEGITWRAGDMVGCLLIYSRTKGTRATSLRMQYFLNGLSLGEAFLMDLSTGTGSSSGDVDCIVYPCVSMESAEAVAVNLGQWREKRVGSTGDCAHNFDFLPSADSFPDSAEQQIISTWTVQLPGHLCRVDIAPGACTPLAATTDTTFEANSPSRSFPPVDLWADEYSTVSGVVRLGLEHLKHELDRRGLKGSGTLEQRAARLFAVRGLTEDQIPAKLKKK